MNTQTPPTGLKDFPLIPKIMAMYGDLDEQSKANLFPQTEDIKTQLEALLTTGHQFISLYAELESMIAVLQKNCEHSFGDVESLGSDIEKRVCTICKLEQKRKKPENFTLCRKCSAPMKNMGIVETCGTHFQSYRCTGSNREHDVMSLV